jgi:PAS domain S-box-containing protein
MAMDGTGRDGVEVERQISVVYVDDYEELCGLAKAGLETASDQLDVETTTDPTSVTDRLEEFDCVVSDYEMPEIDGLDLLRQVRVLDEDLPFILFTGKGSENVASDAISLGVTDYLTKTGGQERFARLANRIEDAVEANRATEVVERTRSQAAEAIERERARFRALIEHSPAMAGVLDAEGRFEYLSPSVEDVIGYRPRDLQDELAFDYVHEADRERVVAEFEESLSNPAYRPRIGYRFRHADGHVVHLETKAVNRLDDPAVEGFVLNTRDVTAQRRTEEKLRRERDISRRMLEVSPAPLMLVDGDGEIRRANYRAAETVDMTRERLEGLSPASSDLEIRTPDGDQLPIEELIAPDVATSGVEREGVEYHVELPTGTFRMELSAAPLAKTDFDAAVVCLDDVERI